VTGVSTGMATPVLKRSGKKKSDGLYWSMLTRERTLDLEAESQAKRDWAADNMARLVTYPALLQQAIMELYTSGRWRPAGLGEQQQQQQQAPEHGQEGPSEEEQQAEYERQQQEQAEAEAEALEREGSGGGRRGRSRRNRRGSGSNLQRVSEE
jgi:hypothetical protein